MLEQPNVGIVIGATARFHSTVDLVSGTRTSDTWNLTTQLTTNHCRECLEQGLTSIHQQGFRIVVHSPQFYKRYEYCLDLSTFELTAAGWVECVAACACVCFGRLMLPYVRICACACCTSSDQSPNVFVEKCLQITLLFLKEFMGQEFYAKVQQLMNAKCSLEITLQADNDFYSQIQEVRSSYVASTISRGAFV